MSKKERLNTLLDQLENYLYEAQMTLNNSPELSPEDKRMILKEYCMDMRKFNWEIINILKDERIKLV